MGKKLYVGNLAFSTTSEELESLFSQAGTCESASVITDRATGRSRGFGFVEMSSADEAERAIADFRAVAERDASFAVLRQQALEAMSGPERNRYFQRAFEALMAAWVREELRTPCT